MTSHLPSTNHIKIARWSGALYTQCHMWSCRNRHHPPTPKTRQSQVQSSGLPGTMDHGLQEAGGAAASSSVRSGEPVTGPCEEEAMIKKHNHRSVEPKKMLRKGEARRGEAGEARRAQAPTRSSFSATSSVSDTSSAVVHLLKEEQQEEEARANQVLSCPVLSPSAPRNLLRLNTHPPTHHPPESDATRGLAFFPSRQAFPVDADAPTLVGAMESCWRENGGRGRSPDRRSSQACRRPRPDGWTGPAVVPFSHGSGARQPAHAHAHAPTPTTRRRGRGATTAQGRGRCTCCFSCKIQRLVVHHTRCVLSSPSSLLL
jgi:hypothetical protein